MQVTVQRSGGCVETDFRITKFFWKDEKNEHLVRCVKSNGMVIKDVRLSTLQATNKNISFEVEKQHPKLKVFDGKTAVFVDYDDDFYDAYLPFPKLVEVPGGYYYEKPPGMHYENN